MEYQVIFPRVGVQELASARRVALGSDPESDEHIVAAHLLELHEKLIAMIQTFPNFVKSMAAGTGKEIEIESEEV